MEGKVLVISTSPRRDGNTEKMCRALMRGAEASGKNVSYLNVNDFHIAPCLGCDYCMSHNGICAKKDDMEKVMKEIKDATFIVFATPVYFYNMSAQMKTVIDRTYCCYQSLKVEKIALLAACADEREESFDNVIQGVKGYAACLDGAEYAGGVFAAGIFDRGSVSDDILAQAEDFGRRL